MGAWKPVLPFGGRTIIEAVVAAALQACSRVILVTGYRGEELVALFRANGRVVTPRNDAWQRGMFSSIRVGAGMVETSRFFVTLGDMPWITPAVYEALLGHGDADVVFPVHEGMRGHPVLFRSHIREAIAAADPVGGSMRGIVDSFAIEEMPWPDDSVLRDIDTENDLP
jgi:molybdenum cofactor cytidylyltransferase